MGSERIDQATRIKLAGIKAPGVHSSLAWQRSATNITPLLAIGYKWVLVGEVPLAAGNYAEELWLAAAEYDSEAEATTI